MNNQLVAITGLGRGESPQPGFAVAASLRRRWSGLRIAGLAYDAMESGLYAGDLLEAAFTIPYPSCDKEILLARIDEIRRDFPFTVLLPTLDAELETLIALAAPLAARGVQTMLPDAGSLQARSKQNLATVAGAAGVSIPATIAASDPREAVEAAIAIGTPVMVKGPFYEAYRADSPQAAGAHAARILAEWGGPVLIQQRITGEEFDLLALGDGQGGMMGSCAVRKLVVSARGKGYAGITVEDPDLRRAARRLIRELNWRGPLELEFLRDRQGVFHLIEINPRFPAWADFPAALGCNLAAAAVQQLLGREIESLAAVPTGKIFLRHSVDLVCDSIELGTLATEGRVLRKLITKP